MDRINKSYYGFEFTSDIFEKYFEFLCRMLGIHKESPYDELFKILFNTKFYSIVDHDENRIEDVKKLIEEFKLESNYISYIDLYEECSVFEILISLAKTMNDSMYDYGIPYWFGIMIQNLGLDGFKGHLRRSEAAQVESILDIFLNRTYSESGLLFPLKNAEKDQRKVELWYQMSHYFNENY